MTTRVRFAPSPTGQLHLGGARTALFNYLYAKKTQGKFILRIEDTDTERSTPEFCEAIFQDLKFLGLQWDEGPQVSGDFGPYLQSQRFNIYQQYTENLLQQGNAYYSENAIRFKVDKNKILKFKDLLREEININCSTIDDFVIVRSNKIPTFNFTNVIDDALMQITHIIRGDDHLPNTPKQILIYEALNFNLPEFLHLPLILGSDGSPMSKRHGDTAVNAYKENGFLPEALINFLVRLGWSYDDKQEIFSMQELAEKFSFSGLTKTAAAFDINKLYWLNSHYIKEKSNPENLNNLTSFLQEKNYDLNKYSEEDFYKMIAISKERAKTYVEMTSMFDYFFEDIEVAEELKSEILNKPENLEYLKIVKEYFTRDSSTQSLGRLEINENELENFLRQTAKEKNIKLRDLIFPLRIAITGRKVSPPLLESMEVLGGEKIINKIDLFLKSIEKS